MKDYLKEMLLSIQARPVEWSEAIRLTLIVLTGFGVWHMTIEQQTMLLAAISGWLSLVARGQVVSNVRVDQKVDERVAHREMVGQTGTGNGMTEPAKTTSGTDSFKRPMLVLALMLIPLFGCAKSAPVLVATDDALHDSLIKIKEQGDKLCSAKAPILSIEICKTFYSSLTPALEAGAAYNRMTASEKFDGLSDLVTKIGRLVEAVKLIPDINRGSMEANLRLALRAAVSH